jgi:uncharacterized protein YndB with AHSA1/START domain
MSAPAASDVGYTREIAFNAPANRVFDALTTLDGLAGWWTPIVSGNPATGGKIKFEFAGLDEEIVMRVEETSRPSTVVWRCLSTPATRNGKARRLSSTFKQTKHRPGCCASITSG